jgi:replication factor A1
MQITYESIIKLIEEKTKLSRKDIDQKIKSKVDSLSGLISKDGAAHIVAHELSVEIKSDDSKGVISVKNLVPGLKNVSVIGKIRKIFDTNSFKRPDGTSGKVRSMFIFDDTDSIKAVMWNDAADVVLNEGDIIRLTKAYVKDNRGNIEINVSFADNVEVNPAGIEIKKEISSEQSTVQTLREPIPPQRKEISALSDKDYNIEIMGTIVQVTDIRFYEVCPSCNKRLKQDGTCQEHGKVSAKYNYVLNIVLDDNSGNIRVVFFNDLIEKLLGMSRDQVLLFNASSGFDKIKDNLLGNIIKVNGRVNNNAMFSRLEFVAKDISIDVDFQSEIEELKKQINIEKIELDEIGHDVDEEIKFDEEELK